MRRFLRRIIDRLLPQLNGIVQHLLHMETVLGDLSQRLSLADERNEQRFTLVGAELRQIEQSSVSQTQLLGQVDRRCDVIDRLSTLIERRTVLIEQRQALDEQRQALGEQKMAALEQRLASVENAVVRIENAVVSTQQHVVLAQQNAVLAQRQAALIEARQAALQQDVQHLLARRLIPLDDNFIATMTPNGWVVLPSEEYGSIGALTDGWLVHEPTTVATLEALLRTGDVAVDAGAHVGLLTVPMARRVGQEGCVIVAEPLPRSAAALRRSLSANSLLDRVELHEVAVHRTAGRMLLHLGENAMMASTIATNAKYGMLEVETATIDSLVGPNRVAAVVKLDVEGAELDALEGMSATIAASPDIVVIAEFGPSHLARAGISVHDWINAFAARELGCMLEIDEVTKHCIPMRPTAALAELYSINLLFSRFGNQRLLALPGVDAEVLQLAEAAG